MSMRILILDNEPMVVETLVTILSQDPLFEMRTAYRGSEAIELANQQDFDAFICDISLPDMTGIDVVREMRFRRICPPFVMMISGAVKAAPRGVSSDTIFIPKPFNPVEIISILHGVHNRKERQSRS